MKEKMSDGYYIPTIDEFIEDFEFQCLITNKYKMVILDFLDGKEIEEVSKFESENWIDCTCDWKYPESKLYTSTSEISGIEFTCTGSFKNFFSQFDDKKIIKLIEDGRIRAKR